MAYRMVSDPATDHLIRWADDGMSFIGKQNLYTLHKQIRRHILYTQHNRIY